MKPAQILSAGLMFFLLFMPVFAFVGDKRVECEVEDGGNCSSYELMQSITGIALLFGFILTVGGAYKMRIYSSSKQNKKFCSKCGSVGAQQSGMCFVCETIDSTDQPDPEQ